MRYAFKAPRVLSQPLSCNVYRMSALAFHTRVSSASVIEEGIVGSGEAARRAGGTGRCALLIGSVAASAARLLFCSGVSALASAHSGGCVHAVLFRGGVSAACHGAVSVVPLDRGCMLGGVLFWLSARTQPRPRAMSSCYRLTLQCGTAGCEGEWPGSTGSRRCLLRRNRRIILALSREPDTRVQCWAPLRSLSHSALCVAEGGGGGGRGGGVGGGEGGWRGGEGGGRQEVDVDAEAEALVEPG